ncbi:hypothetical protein LTR12_004820 [Friedmanniomyces endolithicus]|nr:hypothetical protein LTR74_011278 [Friedmanniomyces endolithicus]KAK1820794.1 hypothetical protein LTR12_004820 [Friedmanniomyces endolithicus]
MASAEFDSEFPCSLLIYIPFPTHRLAKTALRTLSVDEELSPLVKRSFSLTAAVSANSHTDVQPSSSEKPPVKNASEITSTQQHAASLATSSLGQTEESSTVLRVAYKATTNRMLRVAVNGFFESLGVVIQVMEELDVDVLHDEGTEVLEGVQGVEQGLTGTTLTGA